MQIKISFLLCGIILLTKIIAIYITNFDLFGDEAHIGYGHKVLI